MSPSPLPFAPAGPPAARTAAGGSFFLLACLLAGAAGEAPAQSGPVRLRLSPESGQSLLYAYRVDTRIEAPREFGGTRSFRFRLRLRQTAREASGDTVDHRVEILTAAVEGDSLVRRLLPDVGRYAGDTVDARITRSGRVADLGATPRGRAGPAQVQQVMRQSGFPILPVRAVGVGDSWTDTTEILTGMAQALGGGRIRAVSTSTLEEVTRTTGTTVARISVATRYSFLPGSSRQAAIRADMSGSGKATVRFDVDRGRYLSSEASRDFTVNLTIPGTTQPRSVQVDTESSARLLQEASGGASGSR